MKKLATHAIFLLSLCALLLFPSQAALAYTGQDGPGDDEVIVGRSYTLQSGESLPYGLIVIGGSATIEPGASIGGDLVVIGGSANIAAEATVRGEMLVIGGALNLAAVAENNAVVIGGPAKLAETAHIRGDLVTIGGELERAEGAQIDGNITNNPRPPQSLSGWVGNLVHEARSGILPSWPEAAADGLRNALILALIAAGLAAFLPEQMRRVSSTLVSQPKLSVGFGILTLIGFVVVVILLGLLSFLVITLLLTIPAIAFVSLLLATASAFGWIVIGTELGTRLIVALRYDWPLPVSAALGVFLLTLGFSLIEMAPIVGAIADILEFVVSLFGIGAVVMTRFGTRLYVVETIATITQEPSPQRS